MTNSKQTDLIAETLDRFHIELPSWGFANTGTRFGKFLQPAAAVSIEEKFSDAAQVHRWTGVCPAIALHVLWDLPHGVADADEIRELSATHGVRPGSINPNVFQDQIYKYGSLGNPSAEVRRAALDHILDSVEIGQALGSRDLSLWFADGSNYPGTQNIRHRRKWFEEGLRAAHARMSKDQRMLVEYKPFEPAFYHTDIADWGMALLMAQAAGPLAKVLVDTGHHYQAQNIEQIVAWLLDLGMLGGFHFNDRRYADDDLTTGSIDPYQVFRIFHEILRFEWEKGARADIAYMIDQSHNLKGKIEAMIQTVTSIMELFAKAALVDHKKLAKLQESCELVDAESCLKDAFSTDVRPAIREWARAKGLAEDPMDAFRQSGYLERITAERGRKKYVRDFQLRLRDMPRYAFKLRIKADAIEEYEREHTRVWPELLAKLKAVGISDYSIFRRGQDLVLSLRVDDFERAWDELDRDPINRRWQEFMAPLFEPVPDKAPEERFSMMKEVFYLE